MTYIVDCEFCEFSDSVESHDEAVELAERHYIIADEMPEIVSD